MHGLDPCAFFQFCSVTPVFFSHQQYPHHHNQHISRAGRRLRTPEQERLRNAKCEQAGSYLPDDARDELGGCDQDRGLINNHPRITTLIIPPVVHTPPKASPTYASNETAHGHGCRRDGQAGTPADGGFRGLAGGVSEAVREPCGAGEEFGDGEGAGELHISCCVCLSLVCGFRMMRSY